MTECHTSQPPPSATERHALAERELRILTRPGGMSATERHGRRWMVRLAWRTEYHAGLDAERNRSSRRLSMGGTDHHAWRRADRHIRWSAGAVRSR